jgi:hypothetical protein
LRNLYAILDRIEGVQIVKNIEIINKTGTSLGYSPYAYDIPGATMNNVIYPSLDPSIFELKYAQVYFGKYAFIIFFIDIITFLLNIHLLLFINSIALSLSISKPLG